MSVKWSLKAPHLVTHTLQPLYITTKPSFCKDINDFQASIMLYGLITNKMGCVI